MQQGHSLTHDILLTCPCPWAWWASRTRPCRGRPPRGTPPAWPRSPPPLLTVLGRIFVVLNYFYQLNRTQVSHLSYMLIVLILLKRKQKSFCLYWNLFSSLHITGSRNIYSRATEIFLFTSFYVWRNFCKMRIYSWDWRFKIIMAIQHPIYLVGKHLWRWCSKGKILAFLLKMSIALTKYNDYLTNYLVFNSAFHNSIARQWASR